MGNQGDHREFDILQKNLKLNLPALLKRKNNY